ncbi:hydrolase [Pseudonocardiaceae bacterium YIM PH 21723]|nr:hydrolase [Pseudonocardiaceae bacterium YIM PH 21723]
MTIWICHTCGVEHPDAPEPQATDCLICADDRQWIPRDGQRWTTTGELAADGREVIREQVGPNLFRLHREPGLGIGQRTHVYRTAAGNLVWDPPNVVDAPMIEAIEELGGAAVIVPSHPHMFGSQVSWSHHFDRVPVLVNALDRSWVQREDPVITSWEDTISPLPGVTLVTLGGHFPGIAAAVLDSGDLLSGDAIVPTPDGWVTFMRSYPNQIPLSPGLVRRIVDRLEPYEFDRIYGLLGGITRADAKNVVRRSADRYIAWITGAHDQLG